MSKIINRPARGAEIVFELDAGQASQLQKHFLISRQEHPLPEGWTGTACRNWRIGRGPDLPLHELRRKDGTIIGAVLGWVLGRDRILPDGVPIDGPEPGEDLAEWSADLSGRFICLIDDGERAEIILDAGGQLGAVYDPGCRAIASIPALLPGGCMEDEELVAAFGLPARHGWYPFGLTPARGVHRLLPNFALDLDTFTTARIWPRGEEAIPGLAPKDAIPLIYSLTAKNARAIAGEGKFAAHLTAGHDSRMVLAALGPEKARSGTLITIGLPNAHATLDARIAGRVATGVGLRHEIRPYIPARPADLELWRENTGGCMMDVVATLMRTVSSWASDEVQLTGACGEVMRAFYWDARDIGQAAPDAAELLRRLKMPKTARTLSAATSWLDTLPGESAVRIWDLAYIEQRLGCWAGPAVYGNLQPMPSMTPFNSRRIYATMLGMPESYRVDAQSCRDFIAEGWPELCRYPFNSPIGFDRLRFLRAQGRAILPRSLHEPVRRALKWGRIRA